MKNAFYLTLKAIVVLKILNFLFWLFGHVGKRFDMKRKVNFKIYYVTNWIVNNYNIHCQISQEVKAIRQ